MVTVTSADLRQVASDAVDTLLMGLRSDWTVRAGDLEWSCQRTLDHVPDALILYASHLARRATERLPLLRDGSPDDAPDQLCDATRSAAAVLATVADAAGPLARAFHPAGRADTAGFLAMACDELLIHTYDISVGLRLEFAPDPGICARLLARLFPWAPAEIDPWRGLLWANGRIALEHSPRLGADWYWHCAPLEEWDGDVVKRTQPPAW